MPSIPCRTMFLPIFGAFLVLAISGFGCNFKAQPFVKHSAGESEQLASFKADSLPYKNADLVIAGTAMPVVFEADRKPGEVVFFLRSKHGEVLEHEAYRFDVGQFSLWRAGGELYEPVIPLLKDPVSAGASWEWSGQMFPAVDGEPVRNSEAVRKATAKISLASDTLNILGGSKPAMRVNVLLSIDSGSNVRAQRTLSFWFMKDRGLVKRDFAFASTRGPSTRVEP